ncbi:MAG: hypothetical protein ACP5N9_04690 [Candidatus Bilamarchaeum sp.]|jgi:hypothetical protein
MSKKKKESPASAAHVVTKARKEKPLFKAVETWDNGVKVLVLSVIILVLTLHVWTVWQGMEFIYGFNMLGLSACTFILGFSLLAIDYPLFLQVKAMPNAKLDIYREKILFTKQSSRQQIYNLKSVKEIILTETPLRFNSSHFAIFEFKEGNEVMHLKSSKELARKLRPLGFKQIRQHEPNIYGQMIFRYEPDS